MKNLSSLVKDFVLLMAGTAVLLIALAYSKKVADIQSKTPEHDFQLIQLGEMRRDQFLLDRKTGRTWKSICVGEVSGADCNGRMVWEQQPAIGLNGYTIDDLNNYMKYLKDYMKYLKENPSNKK